MPHEKGEVLDYNVQPLPEGYPQIISAMLDRVEVVDGEEFLAGHRLPPDNDEIWRPLTLVRNQELGETTKSPSKLTNHFVREVNALTIALYGFPGFVKWEDITIVQPDDGHESKEPRKRTHGMRLDEILDRDVIEDLLEDVPARQFHFPGRTRHPRLGHL